MDGDSHRFDFAASVDAMLASDPLVRVKFGPAMVDASGLNQLLQAMARKIELQELEMARQRDIIEGLLQDVVRLRSASEDSLSLRRDMKRMSNEVESLQVQHRMNNQRFERMRNELDDIHHEAKQRALGAGAKSCERTIDSSTPPLRAGGVVPPLNSRIFSSTRHADAESLSPQNIVTFSPPQPQGTAPTEAPLPHQRILVSTPLKPAPGCLTPRSKEAPEEEARRPPYAENELQHSPRGVPNYQHPVAGLDLHESPSGLVVTAVKPGGPGYLAGVDANDVILAVDGREVPSNAEWLRLLNDHNIGDSIDLTTVRDGTRRVCRVYLVSGGKR